MFLCIVVLLSGCTASSEIVVTTAEPVVETESTVPEETVPETTVFDDGAVHVSNVDEFLAAIAPDTEIVLAPGEYNLTKAKNYGRSGGEWYHWESVFDGSELVITDVSGLTIRGEDPTAASIVTEPRYANVLRFEYVNDFRLAELTVGHTVERGSCAGGVLQFRQSSNLEIQSSRLYGCGIIGVDLVSCQNVHVDCTDIYECSEGCVRVEESEIVLFENCKFFNCNLWYGVFDIRTSRNVAFINSEVFGNKGIYPEYGSLINADYSDVYLGGLDVHDNSFASLFDCAFESVVVDRCRILDYAGVYVTNCMPVSADGLELTRGDLSNMSMRTVKWEPKEAPEPTQPEIAEDGKIHVSTVDEFLAAIDSNTTIYLEPGVYNLSAASNYGGYGTKSYRWESCYDGYELFIKGVSGLTIEGAGPDQVTIAAEPRYANVLRFENTNGLILRGFTAGHTEQPGECSGGVIQLTSCKNTNIEQCSLYGCGIIGIWGILCDNLYATGTEIYDCSSGAVWLYGCSDVRLDGCDIHDNGGMEFYADYACSSVVVDGKPIELVPAD